MEWRPQPSVVKKTKERAAEIAAERDLDITTLVAMEDSIYELLDDADAVGIMTRAIVIRCMEEGIPRRALVSGVHELYDIPNAEIKNIIIKATEVKDIPRKLPIISPEPKTRKKKEDKASKPSAPRKIDSKRTIEEIRSTITPTDKSLFMLTAYSDGRGSINRKRFRDDLERNHTLNAEDALIHIMLSGYDFRGFDKYTPAGACEKLASIINSKIVKSDAKWRDTELPSFSFLCRLLDQYIVWLRERAENAHTDA